MMTDDVVWHHEHARVYVAYLEGFLQAHGWHAAMAGSVVSKGLSTKDLDVVVFPHVRRGNTPTSWQLRQLRKALRAAGMELTHPRHVVRRGKRWQKSGDTKHVEIWVDHSRTRRIDILVLS